MDTSANNSEMLARFELGMHRFATRTAEAIEGADRETREKGLVWILRGPVGAEEGAFLERLGKLEALDIPKSAFHVFGVANGNGYLITEYIGGTKFPLIEEPFERRLALFRDAIECIARCHAAGVFFGDICEDSFVLRPKGDITLIGLLGSFEKGRFRQAPPAVVYNYLSPEQRIGLSPNPQSDVFALGVLGYRLFSGQYPAMKPHSKELDRGEDPLAQALPPSSLRESCPPWLDTFLGACLSLKLDERYRDAGAMLRSFDESQAAQSCTVPGRWSNYALVRRGETAGVMKSDKRDVEKTSEKRKQAESSSKQEEAPEVRERSYPRYLFLGVFGLILGALAAGAIALFKGPSGKPSTRTAIEYVELLPPELKAAVEIVTDPSRPPQERVEELNRISLSDNPAAYSVLASLAKNDALKDLRRDAVTAVLRRLKDLSYARTAESIEAWTNAVFERGGDPATTPIFGLALRAADLTLPLQVRRESLHKASIEDQSLALRLTTALSFDDVDEEHFIPVLRQLLVAAGTPGDLTKLKLASLIVLNKGLVNIFDRDLAGLLGKSTPTDLNIMLEALAQLDHPLIYDVASEFLRRRILSPFQAVPLRSLLESDRLHAIKSLKIALVRFARNEFQEADVDAVSRWMSLEYEPVLLAVCAVVGEKANGLYAFEALANRGVNNEPQREILKWFQSPGIWPHRRDLVGAFGILGLHKIASDEEISRALEALMPYAVSGTLLEIFINYGDSRLIRMMLERVAAITGSDVLLKLTRHADPKIRISAVKALEGRNEVRVLQDLVRNYEREKDPDVRAVYEQNHWVVRNR